MAQYAAFKADGNIAQAQRQTNSKSDSVMHKIMQV